MADYIPFLTGSFAYGTPKEGSDIDIFMLVSDEEWIRMEQAAFDCHRLNVGLPENATKMQQGSGAEIDKVFITFRSGGFNLLVTNNKRYYECWKTGTEDLIRTSKDNGPIPREVACSYLAGLCQAEGFES